MTAKKALSGLLCLIMLISTFSFSFGAMTLSAAGSDLIGTVLIDGEENFDSDSVAITASNQHRWLSYPAGRIVVNTGNRPALNSTLDLRVGLMVNGVTSVGSALLSVQMAQTGATPASSTSRSTAWYPYKLTATALYGASTVNMTEFFANKDTYVRLMDISGASGREMTLSAAAVSGLTPTISGDTLVMTHTRYWLAYKILVLNEDGTVASTVTPTLNGSAWSAKIPFTTSTAKVAFVMSLVARNAGFANTTEVINRAGAVASGNITTALANTKAYWDGLLAKVPAPTVWGVTAGMDPKGVTPEQHRRIFYSAWAFTYQNIIEPTPETGFNYYQVGLGNASMWAIGHSSQPNSCAWESFFEIQQLSLVEPEIAWSAAEGFINLIQSDGQLAGECLPSQKAHTVWACYQNAPDDARLASLYPKLKSYLNWRANNPRWILGGHNYAGEKDISFVSAWYSDVNYTIKMCEILKANGNTAQNWDAEITHWNTQKATMTSNSRTWFYTPAAGDPVNKVYNTYFTNTGLHYNSARPSDVDNYILTSLATKDYPDDMMEKSVKHYLNIHNTDRDLVGLDFFKYGDGNLIALGLLERSEKYPILGTMFYEFINAVIRNVARVGEFCEESRPENYSAQGTCPTSFTASAMIDFTYYNNGMRIDNGAPIAIAASSVGEIQYEPIALRTVLHTVPELPTRIKAFSEVGGSVIEYFLAVTWDRQTSADFAILGEKTIYGTILSNNQRIVATVTVKAESDVPVMVSNTGKFEVEQYRVLQLSLLETTGEPISGVTWSISDTSRDPIAGINQNGVFQAVKPGVVTVTAAVPGFTIVKTVAILPVNVVTFSYGGTATSNSLASGSNRTYGIDEDPTTWWRATGSGNSQWYTIDLGKVMKPTGIKIMWYEGSQPSSYTIGFSTTGGTNANSYTTVKTVSSPSTFPNNKTDVIIFDSLVETRYIRMTPAGSSSSNLGIIYFQVYATPDITVPVQSVNITSPAGFKIESKGNQLKLGAAVTPSNATDNRVEWTVTNLDGSNTILATIAPTGALTPLGNGKVLVTARSVDGTNISSTVEVEISNQTLVNVALKKTAKASSGTASLAFDGDIGTRWAASYNSNTTLGQQAYIAVDLGVEYEVSVIIVYFEAGFPIDYKVQYSNLASAYSSASSTSDTGWTDIEVVTGNSSQYVMYNFGPLDARYVRIVSSRTAVPNWGFSIWEFEVYGKSKSILIPPSDIVVETEVGLLPGLPAMVDCINEDDDIVSRQVAWNVIDRARYSVAGTFLAKGYLIDSTEVYAVVNVVPYIYFRLNGPPGAAPGKIPAEFGKQVGELPVAEWEGYEFVGWNTQADGQGVTYTADSIYDIHTNLTLHAIFEEEDDWEPIYVGNVIANGEKGFDSDSIMITGSTQPRWISYPESRMVINPGSRPSLGANLGLKVGLFVNGVRNLTSNSNATLCGVQMGPAGGAAANSTSRSTTWYPYKITTSAAYANSVNVNMTEYFANKDVFVRMMDVSGVAGREMTLATGSSAVSGLTWAVQPDGSVLGTNTNYYLAFRIVVLNNDGTVKSTVIPTVNGAAFEAKIPFTEATAKVAYILTTAPRISTLPAADVLARLSTFSQGSFTTALTKAKMFWDGKLGKVPAPTVWGVQAGMDPKDVTPAQHRNMFYCAWAFVISNIIEPTPETGYNYYQVGLGKASMWTGGAAATPNSCAWESMFEIEELALVEPEIAWSAAEGFIKLINNDGTLPGECLPSQKAHMVWTCYENLRDDAKLAELYPKLRAYLLWRGDNPRWIWSSHNYADEKDISFVTQWYSDVNYVIKMCEVLGYTEDIAMWNQRKVKMAEDSRIWFFTPASGAPDDKIYNSCFPTRTGNQYHYYGDRTADVDNYILSALFISEGDFPADMVDKLVNHYRKQHDPEKDLVGLDFFKYGDGCHIAYGLLDKSEKYPDLKLSYLEFLNANIRNVVKVGEFCEESRPNNYSTQGTCPTSFGANTIIDFTYMNNGARIDSGKLAAIDLSLPLATIRFFTNGNYKNLALGRPSASYTASSSQSGNGVANAFNGNTTSRWCASGSGYPQWIQVDLGDTYDITGFNMNWENSAAIYRYTVSVSDSSNSWTAADVVLDRSANSAANGNEMRFVKSRGRYVRLTVTGTGTSGAWASLWQFGVLASAGEGVTGDFISKRLITRFSSASGENIAVSIQFNNDLLDKANTNVYIAVYGGDGKLLQHKRYDAESGLYPLDLPESAASVSVFLWDNDYIPIYAASRLDN